MKILLVLDKPNLNGSELHLLDLANYFKLEETVKVIAFNYGPLLSLFKEKSITYEVIPTGWIPSIFFMKKFAKIVKNFSPDLIHSHQPKANFQVAFFSFFYKILHIATIHSQAVDHEMVYTNLMKRKVVYTFHRFIQFFTELLANKIIYVSHAAANTSFLKSKFVVIHNWLNKDVFAKIPLTTKKNTSKDIIKIVAIGNVSYRKGFDLLLDFATMIKDKYEITIVGNDSSEFALTLKKRIDAKSIKNIQFVQHQSDVSPYLNSADFFVLFSRSETFGLVYIEAMSFGLPVLALDNETMQEVIPPGNSISNNLQDHVKYVYELTINAALYQQVSQANNKFVLENFDYSQAMFKYKNLYYSIAG